MEPITIVVADDHELVRYALRTVLDGESDMEVVAEAQSGDEAVQAVEEHEPTLLLLDLHMDGMDGVEACRIVKERSPETRVLILTSFDDDDEVFGALSAGANGYIMKDVAPQSLLETIRSVAEGRTVLDATVADRLIAGRSESRKAVSAEGLSPRELEVLHEMAKGRSNREIAQAL